jgi:acetoin utilization protein AcuB
MTAAELVTNSIPFLQTTDSVQLALDLMHEFHVSELPVVIDDKPAGLLHEQDLQEADIYSKIDVQMPEIFFFHP